MQNKHLDDDVIASSEDQLNIRIAWYYYITDMTQQQIADRFGITRVRVNKALANSRETGVVQIRINSKLASCIRLEYELERMYGLERVTVVPTPEDERFIFRVLGVGVAPYIHDQLVDGCTLAVGWGRTLRQAVRETRGKSLPNLKVLSLLGGLHYGSANNTAEIASSFASLFGGSYYYLAAPVYASSDEYRDMMLAEGSVQDVLGQARNADMALVTVGDLSKRSLMIELGLVSPEDARTLEAAGAVGDLLGHYLNKAGEEVDHPLNRRVISLDLEDIRHIRKVVLVSGGPYKADIIRAVLLRKFVHELVIDEATAEQLIGQPVTENPHLEKEGVVTKNVSDLASRACAEIAATFAKVDESAVAEMVEELAAAQRIALHGVGREGLMMRALTMRLFHMGLDAHPVGDMTTPAIGAGDLLVVSAGPGEFSTIMALIGVARDAGARVAVITAQLDGAAAQAADVVMCLPAQTMASDSGPGASAVLSMGSAFEGAQYVFFEVLVLLLRERLGISAEAMRARHTNLE